MDSQHFTFAPRLAEDAEPDAFEPAPSAALITPPRGELIHELAPMEARSRLDQRFSITRAGSDPAVQPIRADVATIVPGTPNIGQGATIPTDLGQGSLSIGNRVFLDTDGDGVFTKYIDTTIGDVLVSLYRDVDGDGVADGSPIATSTTCVCGLYGFTGLAAGDYIVVIGQANLDSGSIAGLYSLAGAGDANDGVDADDNGTAGALGIQSGTIHLTEDMAGSGTWSVDFGFTDVAPVARAGASALDGEGDPPPPGNDDECIPSPDDGIFCGTDPGGFMLLTIPNFYEDVGGVPLSPSGLWLDHPYTAAAVFITVEDNPVGLHFLVDGEARSIVSVDDVWAGRVSMTGAPNASGSAQPHFYYYSADMSLVKVGVGGDANRVIAVNDAPVGQDRSVTIAEDTSHTFATTDFPFTDIENHALLGVRITTVPQGGSLLLDSDGNPGTPAVVVTAGTLVSAADIAAGRLTYAPAADGNGAGYGSFTFQVEDEGPQGGYNVNRDVTPRTFTIDVTAAPDLPQATLPESIDYLEGSGAQLIAANAVVHDPDGNWAGGKLVVTGLIAEDSVSIRSVGNGAGEVRLQAATVYYEGAIAGSVTGGQGSNLVITFANGVTEAAVQAITRSLSYANASDTPDASHDLAINLFDSTGASLNGFGGFTKLANFNPFGIESWMRPVFGDVNSDGYVDFMYLGNPQSFLPSLMLGNASGNFTYAGYLPLNGDLMSIVFGVALADTDSDGDLDVIMATETGFAWMGQLDAGGWTDVVWNQYPVPGNGQEDPALSTVSMAFADVDGDGDADLVTTNETGLIHYYRNDAGSFVAASHAFPTAPQGENAQPAILDFDGDGDLDLVIGGYNGIRLFANEGGNYVLKTGADNPFQGVSGTISAGDYDNDGDLDLIVSSDDGMTIYRNETPPGHAVTVTVTAVNDAPSGGDVARTIAEDTPYTFLTSDFAVSDIEGNTLAGIRIATLPAAGTLTLEGAAVTQGQSVSAADIAAGKLVFTPAANGNGEDYSGFTFQVRDTGGTANGGVDLDATANHFSFDVTPVNDAPALTGLAPTLGVNEGAAPTLIDTSVVFVDPDNNFAGGKLSVGGVLAEDRIAIQNEGTGAGQIGVSGVNVTYGGVTIATFAGGNGQNLIVNFNGSATSEAVDSLLQHLTYANASDTPTASRQLTINVFDSTGAGLGGPPAFTKVPDGSNPFFAQAPTPGQVIPPPAFGDLDGDGDTDFVSVEFGTGMLRVGLYDGDGNFTLAPDHAIAATAPVGIGDRQIALADLNGDSRLDILYFGGDFGSYIAYQGPNGSWSEYQYGGLTGLSLPDNSFALRDIDGDGDPDAVLAMGNGTMRYYRNDSGSFVERTGSDNPFASLLLPAEVAYSQYALAVFDLDGDGDMDVVAGDMLFSSVGLSVFRNDGGSFTRLTGSDNPFGNIPLPIPSVGDADDDGDDDLIIGANVVQYFRNDTTGAPQITVTVQAVNDAPAGADLARTIVEDANYTFAASDFAVSDIEGNTLAGIRIATLPAVGTLTLDGVAVTEGQSVSAADIAAGKLVFTPGANANGEDYAGFTFQVRDNGGTANGGVDLDSTPNHFGFDVTPVNDDPVVTLHIAEAALYNQSGAAVLVAPGATIEDLEGNFVGATLTVEITGGGGDGDLLVIGDSPSVGGGYPFVTYLGVVIAALSGGTGSDPLRISFNEYATLEGAQAVLRAIGFANDAAEMSGDARTLYFALFDGNGGEAAIRTASVDVNLAPTAIAATGATWLWDETASADHFVASLAATDADDASGFTYALTSDDSRFYIANGNEIWERAGAVADFETTPSVTLQVRATDAHGASFEQGVTIGVNDFWDPNPDYKLIIDENSAENPILLGPAGGGGFSLGVGTEFYLDYIPLGNLLSNSHDEGAPATTYYDMRFTAYRDLVYADSFHFNVLNVRTGTGPDGYLPVYSGSFDLIVRPVAYDADLHLAATSASGFENNAIALPASSPTPTQGTDQVTGITIAGLPVGAVLSDGTHSFTATESATTADVWGWTLSALTVTPPPGISGSFDLTYTATVTDSAVLKGVEYSDTQMTAATIHVTVAPINHAPAGIDGTIDVVEDTAYVFAVFDFGLSDADGNTLGGVTIATLPGAGLLQLDGQPVTAGQSVSAADILAGRFSFLPAADANGSGYANFTFLVRDNGGTAHGGVDVDATPNTVTLNVTPVDDGASPSDDLAQVAENACTTIAVRGNDIDSDGGPAETIVAIEGNAIAAGGTIELMSGARVTLNPDGTLTYDPNGRFNWLISPERAAATGATNGQSVEMFGYALSGGGTATVSVTVLGVNSAGDKLLGNDAANVLLGTSDNDVIDGGLGADRMRGGLGDDIFYIDNAGDRALEYEGQGRDTVFSSVSYSLGSESIETLVLTGHNAINGAGNGLANVLTGNDAANALSGDGGNDVIDGGLGVDRMRGGLGDDIFIVDNAGDQALEFVGEGYDIVRSSVSYVLGSESIEALVLTGGAAINGTGNGLDNVLTGNDAANALSGGGGNDVINGGLGADRMRGGLGDDIIIVDNAGDQALEFADEGYDTVRSSVSYVLGGSESIEALVLTGHVAINGTGNGLNNVLTGNDAANALSGGAGNDVIDGGSGADRMRGGLGDDSFHVDDAGDQALEYDGEGYDTVYSSVNYSLGSEAIEALTLTGIAAINGLGNGLDNVLTGNNAANRLNGGGGDDALHGGLGADTLTGGTGADSFWFDTALGGGNVDRILDFDVGADSILLDGAIFGALGADGVLASDALVYGTIAQDADDRILYDSATGRIYYDADGSGAGAAVQFAQITAGTALTNAHFTVFGTSGGDDFATQAISDFSTLVDEVLGAHGFDGGIANVEAHAPLFVPIESILSGAQASGQVPLSHATFATTGDHHLL